MAKTLKINPTALKAGVKQVRSAMSEYEAAYKSMLSCLDSLGLDATQTKALQDAAASMKTEFDKMKNHLNGDDGVLALYETAADTYNKANV